MIGSFNDVFIWVSPRIQDGSIWSIDAKEVTYEIDAQGVAKLSIVTRNSVKVEPSDDGARSACTTLFSPPVEEKSCEDESKTAGDACDMSPSSSPFERPKLVPRESSKNPRHSKASASVMEKRKEDATSTLKKQINVKLKSTSAPGGATSSKPGKSVGAWSMCCVPGCPRKSSSGRRCWRHGSVGCCNVEGCSTPSQGIIKAGDHLGPPGRRCRRHGGYKLCDVAGCCTPFQSFILTSDTFGPPGRRCRRHGSYTLCNVEGCSRPSQAMLKYNDAFGPSGRRCLKHRIVVPKRRPSLPVGRSRKSEVVTLTTATSNPDAAKSADQRSGAVPSCRSVEMAENEPSDARQGCNEHGGEQRSNVAEDTFLEADEFGHPGKQCVKHGGRCCNVAGCMSASQDVVAKDDAFGVAGRRCRRHGGFKQCNVDNCSKVAQGRTMQDDAFGVAGRRCAAHGAGRSKAKRLCVAT